MRRIVVFGNSGSGKTTLARVLTSQYGLAHLDLDSLAWDSPGVRRSLTESASTIRDFIHEHSEWVIEGCYGDLLEQVLPYASEVRFLNPGVEACIANCRARPGNGRNTIRRRPRIRSWTSCSIGCVSMRVAPMSTSLARHRELFEGFRGPKVELSSLAA